MTLTVHCISALRYNFTSAALLIINKLNLNCQMNLNTFKYLKPNVFYSQVLQNQQLDQTWWREFC